MKIKDYLGFFTSLVGDEIDYIIHFKEERPEMSKYPNLLKLGNWNNYGDKGYRLVCKIGKEDLLELISIETEIDKSKIEIVIPANNIWIK